MNTIAAAALAVVASAAAAQALTLTATVRDFDNTHPNFGQGSPFGVVTGAVASTLTGAAPTPVFVEGDRTTNPLNFTTHADFNAWWTGPGVAYDVTFDTAGGVASFNGGAATPGSQFFPLGDNNYLFTLTFSGMLSFEAGQTFSATADDDLWIFVDKKLVLDLGGVHAPTTKTFNAATLAGLGLTAGQNYALDVFFAERNVSQSALNLTTTMSLSQTPAPVPLPAPIALLAAGFAGLGLLARRRRTVA